MEDPPQSKSPIARGVFLAIILADVAIILVCWFVYKGRQLSYSSGGLNLAEAPAEEAPQVPQAAPAPPRKDVGSLGLLRKEPAPARPAPQSAKSSAPERKPAFEAEQSGPLVRATKRYFYGLKKSSRFANSKVIRQWEREFLSHGDLRAVDAAYQNDRNAVRFVIGMARSPSFAKMLNKHLAQPDIQAFMMQMATSQTVIASAGIFTKDAEVEKVVDRLEIPGIGSVGKLRGKP